MTTDPGDLVLDPTCGSGTTAYCRRAVGPPLDHDRHLARGAGAGPRPHHGRALPVLPAGRLAATASSRKPRSPAPRRLRSPTHGNIRHGFVYERVPHITLKSIANNAEIDVIWEKWQATLEPLREKLNAALDEAVAGVGDPARGRCASGRTPRRSCTPTGGRRASPGRRRSTPPSPPRPSSSTSTTSPTRTSKKVRVAGPFTVESLSPHRVLGVDENDELIDRV